MGLGLSKDLKKNLLVLFWLKVDLNVLKALFNW